MIEEFFNNAREFIRRIDEFSNFKLNERDDLQLLFSICANGENEKLFEDTIFTAKYVQGLMRVMQKGTANPEIENLESAKKDLTANLEKVVSQIKELISSGNEKDKKYFEDNYLQMTPEAFRNLNKLLADLEWTKMFLNNLKRK